MLHNPIWEGIPFVVVRIVQPGAHTSKEGKKVISALSSEMIVALDLAKKTKFLGPKHLMEKLIQRQTGGRAKMVPIPGTNQLKIEEDRADIDGTASQNPPESDG